MDLREYQTAAITKARHAFAGGKRRLLIYGPTGSGKTVIGEALIRGAVAKGKKVAFVANRITLVKQASKHLTRGEIRHGVIQGDNTRWTDRQVLVCSIQTVARRGIPPVDVIIIDEAHGVPGTKAYHKLMEAHNALPIIGLSATPFAKGLGKEVKELHGPMFEELIVASTIGDLVDQGYLVDCDIFVPVEIDLTGVRTKRNEFGEQDYNESDLDKAMNKPQLVGDIVEHWLELAGHKPTVVFASSIAHSKHICGRFSEVGIPAEHIDCYTDEEERAAIMHRVETGETRVICNVDILTEGWDFPACEVMINARPTKSLTRWIQRAGRILRPAPGKTRGLILDHSGSAHHLGYPTDDLPLRLDGGTEKQSATKPKDKLPKVCPKCKFLKPVGVHECPQCGFAPEHKAEVSVGDGTLTPLARKRASMSDKQDAYSQLLHVAHQRKYSTGWVSHKYRTLFGVWPKGMDEVAKEPSVEMKRWLVSEAIRYAEGKDRVAA